MTARDRCPRLYRALEDERAYQARKRAQQARGIYSLDVMQEEMVRGARLLGRSFQAMTEAMQHMAEQGVRARAALEAMAEAFAQGPSPMWFAEQEQRRREAAFVAQINARQRQYERAFAQMFRQMPHPR